MMNKAPIELKKKFKNYQTIKNLKLKKTTPKTEEKEENINIVEKSEGEKTSEENNEIIEEHEEEKTDKKIHTINTDIMFGKKVLNKNNTPEITIHKIKDRNEGKKEEEEYDSKKVDTPFLVKILTGKIDLYSIIYNPKQGKAKSICLLEVDKDLNVTYHANETLKETHMNSIQKFLMKEYGEEYTNKLLDGKTLKAIASKTDTPKREYLKTAPGKSHNNPEYIAKPNNTMKPDDYGDLVFDSEEVKEIKKAERNKRKEEIKKAEIERVKKNTIFKKGNFSFVIIENDNDLKKENKISTGEKLTYLPFRGCFDETYSIRENDNSSDGFLFKVH